MKNYLILYNINTIKSQNNINKNRKIINIKDKVLISINYIKNGKNLSMKFNRKKIIKISGYNNRFR